MGSTGSDERTLLGRWYDEYQGLLKAIEIEEALDLLVYRPLAFVLSKPLVHTPLTPNMISLLSCGFAMIAAALLWQGQAQASMLAAVAYFISNTLDCADGQLARLKGTSSPFGWAMDGMCDYISTVAIFIGMTHNLEQVRPIVTTWWPVGVVAGVCYGWQCAILDRLRQQWLATVHGRRENVAEEQRHMNELLEQYRREGSHHVDRVLGWGYFTYRRLWSRLTPDEGEQPAWSPEHAERWGAANRVVLRLAVWMGPTTQMTLIMIAAAMNRLDLYIWLTLSLGNAYALLVLLVQRQVNRRLDCEAGAVEANGCK